MLSLEVSLEVAREVSIEVSPEVALEVSPEVAREVSLEAAREVALEVAPEVVREVSLEVARCPRVCPRGCPRAQNGTIGLSKTGSKLISCRLGRTFGFGQLHVLVVTWPVWKALPDSRVQGRGLSGDKEAE